MAKSCFGLYYEHKSKGRTVKKMVKMLQGGRTAAPARTRAEKRARGRQRRRRVLTKLNQSKSLYLFLIPAIVYFIIFCYLPMYGVQIAFKYYSPRLGIWGSTWTGMENLNRFFDSYYFWRLLRNTVGLSLYNLIVAFPFPILLALAFNEVKSPKLKKAVQTISYAPHFISVVVLVGILNLFFNQGNGLINVFLDKMGFEKFGFLTSSAAFPSMYVWSGVWQNAGWNSIIYIAALAAIDPQLHEAAQIDGASRLQRILHINLPGILPTAIIMFILDVGQVMNMGFEKVFLMQNAQNTEGCYLSVQSPPQRYRILWLESGRPSPQGYPLAGRPRRPAVLWVHSSQDICGRSAERHEQQQNSARRICAAPGGRGRPALL